MENFQTQYLAEEHSLIIADVRFRPNTSQLATSSFDRTIKLWNAGEVSSVFMFLGDREIINCTYYLAILCSFILCTRTDMNYSMLIMSQN